MSGIKRCRICGRVRPLTDFYSDKRSKDGYRNICRFCHSDAVTRRQRENSQRRKEYLRHWREINRDKIAKRERVRRLSPAYRAKAIIDSRIYRGTIKRPAVCSLCGAEGREIHAHHPDYTAPRTIVWLCEACHGAVHRLLRRGEVPDLKTVSV